MNAPSIISSETLPRLIDQATSALESARTSAEVLEARDLARTAYDAAKSAGRMAKAKQAHDSLMVEVHRAQGHALAIRARAEMKLAEEYDAAQERGEVAKSGENQHGEVVASANDLGLRRDEIHEARKLRDAEADSPGAVQSAIDGMLERGEEPTRAALRRSVIAAVDDAKRGTSRKNPHRVKDADTDRVFKFAGLCRSIAEFDDVERIAAWTRIPQTAERLPSEVREAMHILSRFMEAKDA